SLAVAREKLEDWRRHHNEDRPHSAIGYRTSGVDIYWAEDLCARDDFEGLQGVRRGGPDMLVNSVNIWT
ncbi:integrase core domain-containing protein, partial [Falsirhodobacter sp. 1013]|uniref:integrase core domain-containing protein n=1 Tax=Falsirhodobacter sp. 1013 TaxID=3417566 RepID=UPI003EBB709B